VLVSLKLYLADGRERQVSVEADRDDPATPQELLERISREGRVRLSDREQCDLDQVERVELVPAPEPRTAPEWIEGGEPRDVRLRDEDVSAALQERRDAHDRRAG
jgi:hypothetical protein